MIKSYELLTLNKKFVRKFQVNHTRKVCEQDIINRIVELGYNPLLYYYTPLR